MPQMIANKLLPQPRPAPSAPPERTLLLTYAEAAYLLRVSIRQVQVLVADGTLPKTSIGGAARVRRADVERLAAGNPARRSR